MRPISLVVKAERVDLRERQTVLLILFRVSWVQEYLVLHGLQSVLGRDRRAFERVPQADACARETDVLVSELRFHLASSQCDNVRVSWKCDCRSGVGLLRYSPSASWSSHPNTGHRNRNDEVAETISCSPHLKCRRSFD